MNISRFVRRKYAGLSPTASLRDAARSMRATGLTSLPVVRAGLVVGLIRERDLVKAMAISPRPLDAQVSQFMSSCVMVSLDDTIPDAIAKMLAVGCLDMAVVDRGQLAGSVSAAELLAAEAQLEGIAV